MANDSPVEVKGARGSGCIEIEWLCQICGLMTAKLNFGNWPASEISAAALDLVKRMHEDTHK